MSKLLFYLMRFILGVYFILYGIKGLGDLTSSNTIASSHLNIMQEKLNQYLPNLMNLQIVKDYSHTVFQWKNLALFYGGLMMLFGGSTAKYFTFIGLSIEMILLASLRIMNDEMSFCSFSAYISLIGVTLSI